MISAITAFLKLALQEGHGGAPCLTSRPQQASHGPNHEHTCTKATNRHSFQGSFPQHTEEP